MTEHTDAMRALISIGFAKPGKGQWVSLQSIPLHEADDAFGDQRETGNQEDGDIWIEWKQSDGSIVGFGGRVEPKGAEQWLYGGFVAGTFRDC